MSIGSGLNDLVPASDTFSDWLTRTNDISEYLRDHIMTASSVASEQDTSGDARLIGKFQANTIIANEDIRGGTLAASANLVCSSNATFQANVTINGELFVDTGRITQANTLLESITFTTTTANTVIDSFPKTDSNGFKYLVQAYDASGDHYMVEFLTVHNDTTASYTRYAELNTGGDIAVELTPVVNGANIDIEVVSNANATNQYIYKIYKTVFI